MKPKIKKLWLKALRSGEYKQCKGQLKGEDGFCCLGVLCDIHRKITKKAGWVINRARFSENEQSQYLDRCGTLPDRVVKWAGLDSYHPEVEGLGLAEWNDKEEASFHDIAGLIETNL